MFNSLQKQIIIGSLLGDGSLITTGGGKRFRFTISHSDKQKDYICWKFNILKKYVPTLPKFQFKTNSWKFNTISLAEFSKLRSSFYHGRQKIVPMLIKMMLSKPRVLAVWYMDDGNLRRQNGKIYGCMLNTQSFSIKDNQKLSLWLKKIYGLRSVLQKNHDKYRLYFGGADNWRKFCDIVAPYLVSSMRYKIP